MSAPIITVDEVTKRFRGGTRALDGLTLIIPTGTVYGLLGPNGAGKTTLIRILATLLRPDGGTARVAGYDVVRHPARVRERIGLAGQFAAVDDHLTGRENIAMIGRLYGLSRREAAHRAAGIVDRIRLADAADRQVRTYSGGMRRRIDLAASLIGRPEVLFLDEPTTGVDPASRQDLWHLVRDLAAEGTTVLLTTQYLDEADQLADRIAVIDRGRKVAEGTADELKASVGQSTLQLQLADPSDLTSVAEEARRLVGEDAVLTPEARRVNVPLRRTDHAIDVLVALRDRGVVIESVTVQKPSLDEVFLALTGHDTHDGTPPSGADDHDLQMEDAR